MFITVLPSDLQTNPWVAVQWNKDLQALMSNNSYRADTTRTFAKSEGDRVLPDTKSITEDLTGDVVSDARVVALAAAMVTKALAVPEKTGFKKKNHHRKSKREI